MFKLLPAVTSKYKLPITLKENNNSIIDVLFCNSLNGKCFSKNVFHTCIWI